ncbi:hypothetical protein [Streptomyces sp. TN58]|uniref:hypothetical protein n=1 Tax=Streptomyces sp. TN58 TaxID=234612 RepID=UPI0009505606|nr:hypothetical protein [Streptomyces sp. TN58]APU38467.1 hypothetical protein BSL84_00420 [Streptomyces sp. TN58]APU43999.1 hypothetical protein BSL84_34085 [Streptomyces sp. TN58]
MPAHSKSVFVRPDPRRLLVLAAPAVLVALNQGLTSNGQVLPRPVYLALGAAFAVCAFALRWLLAVSIADGYIAVSRGLTPHRLALADLDSVEVEEAGRLGYVIRCRQAGEPELKVPLTMMRQSDQRLVIEAVHAAVRPGVLRGGAALRAFTTTP